MKRPAVMRFFEIGTPKIALVDVSSRAVYLLYQGN
jgi:hypothetical protein